MDEIIKALIENGGGLLTVGVTAALTTAWTALHKRKPTKAEEKQIEKAAASLLVAPSAEEVRKYGVSGRVADAPRNTAAKKTAAKKWSGYAMRKAPRYSSHGAKKVASKRSSAKKVESKRMPKRTASKRISRKDSAKTRTVEIGATRVILLVPSRRTAKPFFGGVGTEQHRRRG